jgi:hypothetical protein
MAKPMNVSRKCCAESGFAGNLKPDPQYRVVPVCDLNN